MVFGAVALFFALAATAHVAIAVGLVRQSPRWRGPVAFLVAPLAPYWAFQSGMRGRGGVWLVAVIGYVVLRALYRR